MSQGMALWNNNPFGHLEPKAMTQRKYRLKADFQD
jgi:hypothetical protein